MEKRSCHSQTSWVHLSQRALASCLHGQQSCEHASTDTTSLHPENSHKQDSWFVISSESQESSAMHSATQLLLFPPPPSSQAPVQSRFTSDLLEGDKEPSWSPANQLRPRLVICTTPNCCPHTHVYIIFHLPQHKIQYLSIK